MKTISITTEKSNVGLFMTEYVCPKCSKRWSQEHYFDPETCIYCGEPTSPVNPLRFPIFKPRSLGMTTTVAEAIDAKIRAGIEQLSDDLLGIGPSPAYTTYGDVVEPPLPVESVRRILIVNLNRAIDSIETGDVLHARQIITELVEKLKEKNNG